MIVHLRTLEPRVIVLPLNHKAQAYRQPWVPRIYKLFLLEFIMPRIPVCKEHHPARKCLLFFCFLWVLWLDITGNRSSYWTQFEHSWGRSSGWAQDSAGLYACDNLQLPLPYWYKFQEGHRGFSSPRINSGD